MWCPLPSKEEKGPGSVSSRHFGKGGQNGVCNKLGGLCVMREARVCEARACEARP